jgi:hypothetical protein
MNTESNDPSPEPLITAGKLAISLGVTVPTIREWCIRGVGPRAYVIGEYPMFEGADVQEWLEQCRENGLPSIDER